jgi:NitT/TauT family transport system permease protein
MTDAASDNSTAPRTAGPSTVPPAQPALIKPAAARSPGWWDVRRPLPTSRASLLTAFSFLLPLALWCIVSYVPFIWHPDVRLEISADRSGSTTVYTAGDHVSRDYFPEIVQAVQADNVAIAAIQSGSAPSVGSDGTIRRENIKKLRQIVPVALAHRWLKPDQREDDAAIAEIWKGLATGSLISTRIDLTAENRAIIAANWARLAPTLAAGFDFKNIPAVPLLKLVPQGRLTNPDYLPAPHEVLTTGLTDWTSQPDPDKPWMYQRLLHSVRIILGGFLLSCLIGVPLGILCGTYDSVSRLCEPFIDFFRYLPAPAFSTLLVAVFLAHDAPKIALVFVGTFFQMVLVVSKTTRLLDHGLLEAAQTLGADNRSLLTRVIIPGILPNLYNDLRILLGWAWTWLVIAELIGVKSGLTEFIETQGRWRNFERVFPVIIAIGLLGFATDQFLNYLRRFLFPWDSATAGRGGNPPMLRRLLARLRPGHAASSEPESARVAPH